MNFSKKDDYLIRAGYVLGFLVLVTMGPCIQSIDKDFRSTEQTVATLFYVFFASLPLWMIIFGYKFRAREKKLQALFKVLLNTKEVLLNDITSSMQLSKEDVLRGLAQINRNSGYLFIYQSENERIVDARLRTQTVRVEHCPTCNANIGLQLNLSLESIPACPHCGRPLDIEAIDSRKHDKIMQLNENDRHFIKQSQAAKGYNSTTFILLLVFFWPLGLAYYMKHNQGRQLDED